MSNKKATIWTVQDYLNLIEWATNGIKEITAQNPSVGTVQNAEGTSPNPPLPPHP